MNYFTLWNHHHETAPPAIAPADDDDASTSSSSVSSSSSLSLNEIMSSTVDFDTIRAMCQQEKFVYKKYDPLRHRMERTQENDIDEICRDKMCEWSYQIVDFCKFHRESVDIAMNYLDRFLLTKFGQAALHDRNVYQLVAMTCLYSAIKIHERQALSPSVVSQLSRGVYSAQQITETEVTILHALQWQLHPPTALSFVRELITALPIEIIPESIKESILDITQKETELAVSDYRFIETPMSTVAYCSILNALQCCGYTFSADVIYNIRAMMASAIGLTEPLCREVMEIQMLLSTVCPISDTITVSSILLTQSFDNPLDYSTSTMDMEEAVQSQRDQYRNDGNIKSRTKHQRCTTFDVSPRCSATVAVSTTSTVATSNNVTTGHSLLSLIHI